MRDDTSKVPQFVILKQPDKQGRAYTAQSSDRNQPRRAKTATGFNENHGFEDNLVANIQKKAH